jgi:hypothetical protein
MRVGEEIGLDDEPAKPDDAARSRLAKSPFEPASVSGGVQEILDAGDSVDRAGLLD